MCPSSRLNSRFPASQTTCGESKLITIKQGYLVSSSLTKDIDEGHWQTSPEDKSLNNTWLTPLGLNLSSKFKWFCTQASVSVQANVGIELKTWVTACMANPFQCVCLVHDKEINWNVNKFNEYLQWANIGRCCAEFPCLVSLAIKPNCMAHFWCLIKIVQCFPLIKYTRPCTVILPHQLYAFIWQAVSGSEFKDSTWRSCLLYESSHLKPVDLYQSLLLSSAYAWPTLTCLWLHTYPGWHSQKLPQCLSPQHVDQQVGHQPRLLACSLETNAGLVETVFAENNLEPIQETNKRKESKTLLHKKWQFSTDNYR